MPETQDLSPLVPSILDRLLGQDLPSSEALERRRAALFRQLKVSLQRDLENLLNTRCRCGSFPPELAELKTSLVNYGIPDFTGANIAGIEGRQEFLQLVQDCIERFEPRLDRVQVSLLENDKEPLDRVLRFRIEAVVATEDAAEPVAFLSTMEPSSGKLQVNNG
jgi:type VI secretion system protein ImpF